MTFENEIVFSLAELLNLLLEIREDLLSYRVTKLQVQQFQVLNNLFNLLLHLKPYISFNINI